MRNLEDLQHFVLQPDEVLILRCTRHFSPEQLEAMRQVINRHLPGRTVLVLPPDIEVHAGVLEVMGATSPMSSTELTQDEIDAMRAEIQAVYDSGQIIYANEGGGWFGCHKSSNPIGAWDWERVRYSLTKPKMQG